MKSHPDCAKECQYAKDIGMWPEHQCAGVCQYSLRSDGPEERKCPHCQGDLSRYEDPLAKKMLADNEERISELQQKLATQSGAYSGDEVSNLCRARTEAVEMAQRFVRAFDWLNSQNEDFVFVRVSRDDPSTGEERTHFWIFDDSDASMARPSVLEAIEAEMEKPEPKCAKCGRVLSEHMKVSVYRCPFTTGSYTDNNYTPPASLEPVICPACECVIDSDGCGCNPHDA